MGSGKRKNPDYAAQVLRMLRAGACTSEQIKARYGLHRKVLDRLEQQGLLTRASSPRQTLHAITPAGVAACPPRNPASAGRALAEARQGQAVSGPGALRQGGFHPGRERFE